jgi:hypothetical protein
MQRACILHVSATIKNFDMLLSQSHLHDGAGGIAREVVDANVLRLPGRVAGVAYRGVRRAHLRQRLPHQ